MKAIRFILASALAVAMISCNGAAKTEAEAPAADTIVAETDVVDAVEDVVYEFKAEDKIPAVDVPVVIDFNAVWCGPCQKFGPVFHEVAEEYASKAKFAAVDVDVCPDLAKAYNVENIPAIVIIYPEASGKAPVSTKGYMDATQFKAFLDTNL